MCNLLKNNDHFTNILNRYSERFGEKKMKTGLIENQKKENIK